LSNSRFSNIGHARRGSRRDFQSLVKNGVLKLVSHTAVMALVVWVNFGTPKNSGYYRRCGERSTIIGGGSASFISFLACQARRYLYVPLAAFMRDILSCPISRHAWYVYSRGNKPMPCLDPQTPQQGD
jgi:hypothetical protein